VTGWTYRLATEPRTRPRGFPYEIALFPDILVYTTREDIIAGRDAQMEKLREIIASVPGVTITPAPPPQSPPPPPKSQPAIQGSLPYIRSVAYNRQYRYFNIWFTEPIAGIDAHGVTVFDSDGRPMTLREVTIGQGSPGASESLIISSTKAITDPDTCVIVLRAGAVTLASGRKNEAVSFTGTAIVATKADQAKAAPTEDWTKGELPPYVQRVSYVERFHYFIVIFDRPILALNPYGIKVTDASGRDLELKYVPNLTPISPETLTISPLEWLDEDDNCTITLPAGAVLLEGGFANPPTLRLGKYHYSPYP